LPRRGWHRLANMKPSHAVGLCSLCVLVASWAAPSVALPLSMALLPPIALIRFISTKWPQLVDAREALAAFVVGMGPLSMAMLAVESILFAAIRAASDAAPLRQEVAYVSSHSALLFDAAEPTAVEAAALPSAAEMDAAASMVVVVDVPAVAEPDGAAVSEPTSLNVDVLDHLQVGEPASMQTHSSLRSGHSESAHAHWSPLRPMWAASAFVVAAVTEETLKLAILVARRPAALGTQQQRIGLLAMMLFCSVGVSSFESLLHFAGDLRAYPLLSAACARCALS
jgi:hypothetical protein